MTTDQLFTIRPLEWEWLTINGIGVWNADAPIGNLNWRLYPDRGQLAFESVW